MHGAENAKSQQLLNWESVFHPKRSQKKKAQKGRRGIKSLSLKSSPDGGGWSTPRAGGNVYCKFIMSVVSELSHSSGFFS
jgi:hypothetical protein